VNNISKKAVLLMKDDSYVRMVDFTEDEPETIYCPLCEKLGFKVRLGPKVILAGTVREPDADNFLQCPECGWLCPISQVEPEPAIQDSLETIESPLDNAQGQFLSTENRTTQTQKRKRKQAVSSGVTKPRSKRFSQKGEQKIDPDIEREIYQHGEDNVKVVYDSSS
jgi:hypothetical protein